jgi:hypothetical protein
MTKDAHSKHLKISANAPACQADSLTQALFSFSLCQRLQSLFPQLHTNCVTDVTEMLEPSNMDGTVQGDAAVTQQLDEPKADVALTMSPKVMLHHAMPAAEAMPASVAEASSLAQPQGVSQKTHCEVFVPPPPHKLDRFEK